jgi:hypothetical protein
MRKLPTLAIALLLTTGICQAQLLSKVIPPSTFSLSLSKVVENFQNNYYRIQGTALPPDEDRDIFLSDIRLPGASSCVIFRFHSREDTAAGWQAVLYTGENYSDALKIYKNAFRQLKQTKFSEGITRVSFEGELQLPAENIRFTSSILRPAGGSETYKHFIAEVEILNSMEGWLVQLNLHSRKDDEERY